jgi:hypothetical protein
MTTSNLPLLAAMILPSGMLMSQCAPDGGIPPQTEPGSSAPAEKESMLKVTLLQPEPIRLEAAQIKQLEAARKLVERMLPMSEEHRKTGPDGLKGFQQRMQLEQELEQELQPYRKLEQGVKLRMRITNTGKDPVTLRYGPDLARNTLKIRGRGALEVTYSGPVSADFRFGQPVSIAPGGSTEFVVAELRHGSRDLDRWLITRPGEYEIRVIFSTVLKVDTGGRTTGEDPSPDGTLNLVQRKGGYQDVTVTSNPVILKVTD